MIQAGANWNNGVNAGSRAVNANNVPWNMNTNVGSRLACENRKKQTATITVLAAVTDCQITLLAYWQNYDGAPPAGWALLYFYMRGNALFEKVYNYQSLYEAYLKARKQKRYRGEVLQFSYSLEENLIALQNELIWRTYRVGAYRPFVVYEPKKRQIVALPFRDRVVQHSLNMAIEPLFEKRMIYDSYACRIGKGTHQAARRLSYFMGKPGNHYYLKADIKSYFASINRVILKDILIRHIADEGVLWLVNEVLNSTPGTGLPIGNLMSQLFANVYLHELDHYIKNVRAEKYYLRYMDDFIIMHPSKAHLWELLNDIEGFLKSNLALSLNSKTKIGKKSEGIEFVGYRIWDNNKLIKKQSLSRMKKKARAWRNGKIGDDRYLASLGSWMGHSADTASHRAVEKIMLDSLHHLHKRIKPEEVKQ